MEDEKVLMPRDFDKDPWVAAFICELHMFFGSPVSSDECKSKTDKLLYIWSMIGISGALRKEEKIWRALKDRVEPNVAAESFSRYYWTTHGKMIVEEHPNFLARGNYETKALTQEG